MAKAKPRTGELTTTYLGLTKPTVGASDDQWGGYINGDLDIIDTTVNGVSNVANAAYPASNPSGYQTAAQVTASLGPYLLKSGGTLTGALTPSSTAGIIGTTAADNANAGSVGEVISSNVTTGVGLTSGTSANVTSISLTAGDWDVQGEVWFNPSAACSGIIAGVSVVNATMPGGSSTGSGRNQLIATITASPQQLPVRTCRANLTATTPYYLVAQVNFASGTCTATGNIWARRVR